MMATIDPASARLTTNPYPGLEPFQEGEAERFFGRDEEVAELLRLAATHRFVSVLGVSGCGKSSLVRAGFIPLLRLGMGERLGGEWRIAVITPGRAPLKNLRRELSAGNDWPGTSFGLVELAQSRLEPGEKLLVFVDQFEELFTFRQESAARDGGNEAALFVNLLLRAAEQREQPIYLLLSMRSDYLGQAAQFRGLAEAMNHGHYLVPRMTRHQQQEAIERPLEGSGVTIHAALVQRLLNDSADQPDQLPVLQHLLKRLWEKRSTPDAIGMDDYLAAGGWASALDGDAEEVYGRFRGSTAEDEIRLLFQWITDKGTGLQPVRRPALFSELLEVTNAKPQDLRFIVRAFQERDLLRKTGADVGDDALIDLPHESVAWQWQRLRSWIDEEAESAARLRFIRDSAERKVHLTGSALREALGMKERLRSSPQWGARYLQDAAVTARVVDWIGSSRWAAKARNAALLILATLAVGALVVVQYQRGVTAQKLAESASARLLIETEAKKSAEESLKVTDGLLVATREAEVLATRERQRAEENAQAAEGQRLVALSRQLAAQATRQVEQQLDLALLLGTEATRIRDTTEARSSLLGALARSPAISFTSDSAGGHLAFQPGGETLVSVGDRVVRWDTSGQQASPGSPIPHGSDISSLALSTDGQTVALGRPDGTIVFWDVEAGRELGQPVKGHEQGPYAMAFSADNKKLVSISSEYGGTLVGCSVPGRKPIGQPLIVGSQLVSLALSPDGGMLAAGMHDYSVVLWDLRTGIRVPTPLKGHGAAVSSIAFSPDGKLVASAGGADATIRIWSVSTQQLVGAPLTGHTADVKKVVFSPDGQILASGSSDKSVRLWDVRTRAPVGLPLRKHTAAVTDLAFSPDSRLLASASEGGTLVLWDRQPLADPLRGQDDRVYSAAFSPNGQILASSPGDDPGLLLWNVKTRRKIGQPIAGIGPVAFSPDGKTVACSSLAGILLSDVATQKPKGPPLPSPYGGLLVSLGFSPDGKTLAAGDIGMVLFWDLEQRKPLGSPLDKPLIAALHVDEEPAETRMGAAAVGDVVFSPDGKILASGAGDGTVILWDVATRRMAGDPLGSRARWASLAFSPDGRTLAVASREKPANPRRGENSVTLWNVATRRAIGRLEPASGPVAFSPDGRFIASSSQDDAIWLWDVETEQTLAWPLRGHTLSVNSLAFSPDGALLASTSGDETVILWDVALRSWQERACAAAGRNLSRLEWERFVRGTPYRRTCPDLPEPEESISPPR
jgi:WD40 repeat protein